VLDIGGVVDERPFAYRRAVLREIDLSAVIEGFAERIRRGLDDVRPDFVEHREIGLAEHAEIRIK
jgi:hypothetical protein